MLQINAPNHPMSIKPATTLTNKTTHRYLQFLTKAITVGKKNITNAIRIATDGMVKSDVIVCVL